MHSYIENNPIAPFRDLTILFRSDFSTLVIVFFAKTTPTSGTIASSGPAVENYYSYRISMFSRKDKILFSEQIATHIWFWIVPKDRKTIPPETSPVCHGISLDTIHELRMLMKLLKSTVMHITNLCRMNFNEFSPRYQFATRHEHKSDTQSAICNCKYSNSPTILIMHLEIDPQPLPVLALGI